MWDRKSVEMFQLSLIAKNKRADMVGLSEEFEMNDTITKGPVVSFGAYPLNTENSLFKTFFKEDTKIKMFALWTTDEKTVSATSKVRQTKWGMRKGKKIRKRIFSCLIFGVGDIINFSYFFTGGILRFQIGIKLKKGRVMSSGNINKFVKSELGERNGRR